ncbi:hypothetical protein, partial [Duganella lactea]|uniref:hypothetical protein n=1 Tax=Duganella lactea TaxID=2692173 RepID=UPI001E3066D2
QYPDKCDDCAHYRNEYKAANYLCANPHFFQHCRVFLSIGSEELNLMRYGDALAELTKAPWRATGARGIVFQF